MTAQDAINAVLDLARSELGYHEKASNNQLNDKTANSGGSNWTKYAEYIDSFAGFYNRSLGAMSSLTICSSRPSVRNSAGRCSASRRRAWERDACIRHSTIRIQDDSTGTHRTPATRSSSATRQENTAIPGLSRKSQVTPW